MTQAFGVVSWCFVHRNQGEAPWWWCDVVFRASWPRRVVVLYYGAPCIVTKARTVVVLRCCVPCVMAQAGGGCTALHVVLTVAAVVAGVTGA